MFLQEKYIYLHNKDITWSYFSFYNNSSPETALPFILGKNLIMTFDTQKLQMETF